MKNCIHSNYYRQCAEIAVFKEIYIYFSFDISHVHKQRHYQSRRTWH